MAEKTYTGATLERALRDNSLTRSGIVLVGMVKASEKGEHVSFTKSGCESWVDLPVEMIECAELVGQTVCKDHSHPLMKIALKEPKDAEGQIYAALLAQPASANVWPMPPQGPSSDPHVYSSTQVGTLATPVRAGVPQQAFHAIGGTVGTSTTDDSGRCIKDYRCQPMRVCDKYGCWIQWNCRWIDIWCF